MANIIITTHWGEGDVLPFIAIGKELKDLGHSVTIFTHYCHGEKIKRENIKFIPLESSRECKDFFDALISVSNRVSEINEIEEFRKKYENKEVYLKEYNLLKPYCENKDTIIIAKNRSSIAALLLAEQLNLPLISVYMNPYEYESIKSFHDLKEKELLKEANGLREEIGLPSIKSWINWQFSPKVKIGLWPSWYKNEIINSLEDIKAVGFPLRDLDLSNISLESPLKEILETKPEPVIVSGGSSNKIKNIFYETAIEACSNLDRKIIVITKYKERLPKKLPENIYYFEYIPLYQSLTNVSLIIHHGGIGTIGNAIKTGVPQLILADCNDTPLNGSIVKKIKVGDYLPPSKWQKNELIERINKLLSKEFKEKCENFAKEHSDENAFDLIVKLVEEAKNNEKYCLNYELLNSDKKENLKNSTDTRDFSKKLLSEKMQKYLLKKLKNK